MSSYLTTSAAASTYYLQTNPDGFITSAALVGYATETFVTTQGYITQTTADGLYYPLSGNPSAFITAGYLASYAELAGAAFTGPVSTSDTVTVGSFNPDPTLPSNGEIWFNQPLAKLRFYDSFSTKSVASEAWASAAFYPLSGNPSGFATLSSPTFTGTPTLPTGTIATTQSPGNNTTALATTAFVQQEVPDFATLTDVIENPSSTTLALNPSLAPWLMANANVRYFGSITFSSTSGGGVVNYGTVREIYTQGVSQRATALDAPYGNASYGIKSAAEASNLNFSKKHWLFGVYFPSAGNPTSYYGNANTVSRINLGGRSSAAVGNLTQKGIGLYKAGGTGSLIYLTVHNGTTLTSVSSGVTNATGQSFKYVIYSDGTGNVTLYLDGVSVATTSAGPTGTTTTGYSIYEEQVESNASGTVFQAMLVASAGIIIER
jgi:hypothetical protein